MEKKKSKKLTEDQAAVVKRLAKNIEEKQIELQEYLREIDITPVGGWRGPSTKFVFGSECSECTEPGCYFGDCPDCSDTPCAPDPQPPDPCPAGPHDEFSCIQVQMDPLSGFCTEVIGEDIMARRINIQRVRLATSGAVRIYVKRSV